jgi:Abnormal spindle-like microcephaly-assoc'd, ASPM-SPD-2-Hydin/Flagellar-associated PapD-like
MVGKLWTGVRLTGFAVAFLATSAILLAATPSASPAAGPNRGISTTRTSTEPARTAAPKLMEVTPDAVSFLEVPAGETYTQTVRITNISEGTFQIKRITASSAEFGITGIVLPVVVAPGMNETFTISYKGAPETHADAQLRIVTSAGDMPLALKAKASAMKDERELTASEAGIKFEDVAVGNSSEKEVVLTNTGNRALNISGVSVSGAEFSLSGAGAVSLSPGQKISLDVKFAPKSVGRQTSNLRVLSAEGGSLLEIPLNAAGVAASQNVVKLNWEENPASVGGYVIYRSADPTGPFTRLPAQAIASAEYVDTGLAAGHTYYYVVTSVGADEVESEYSTPISATVPEA